MPCLETQKPASARCLSTCRSDSPPSAALRIRDASVRRSEDSAVLSMPAGNRASNSAHASWKTPRRTSRVSGPRPNPWCRISAMKSSLTEPFFALASNIAQLHLRRGLLTKKSIAKPSGGTSVTRLSPNLQLPKYASSGPHGLARDAPLQSAQPVSELAKSMTERPVQRRLVAILAADVVGFSRLMERDEAGTLSLLKDRREQILDREIARHGGRIVKVMGDGLLIEFASAVQAVESAVAVQQAMAAANADVAADQRIVLRIGVNLGDVIIDGEDLYGDGVNIAARLQALAEPGDIWLSRNVHDQVETKLDLAFEDLGLKELKNLVRPVQVFRITGAGQETAQLGTIETRLPSLAILPFANMSGEPEQRWFSDGITEDIITELSRFRQLKVVARNSSFRYRDLDVDIRRVGRELGVQYVVEGSVRRLGKRLRITAQLIDAATGNHLWAERFDRDESEIFAVQDQLVRTIVATLVGRLQAAGVEGAKRKAPASLAAYECVLRADALPLISDPAIEAEAQALSEQPIELDPTYARAYALLANLLRLKWDYGASGDPSLLARALELARKAVALDENDGMCHGILGFVHLARYDHDLAEHHYQKAQSLNPNSATLSATTGVLYTYLGRPGEALDHFREARNIDPFFNPTWYWSALGAAHLAARQYPEAIAAINRLSARAYWSHANLAAAHAYAGQPEQARHHATEVQRLFPGYSVSRHAGGEPFKRRSDLDHLLNGLRLAGLPD